MENNTKKHFAVSYEMINIIVELNSWYDKNVILLEENRRIAKTLLSDKNLSVKPICERLGIAKSTLYKYAGFGAKKP